MPRIKGAPLLQEWRWGQPGRSCPRESKVGLEGLKGGASMGHQKDRDVGLFETHRTLSVKGRRRRGARLVLGTEKSSL